MEAIDLRSDTVTLPTVEMRRAMADAELGDDVFNEDPTVGRLEEMAAGLMGQETSLFMPSGTMSNLVSVLSWCQRGDEILIGSEAHMFWNEVGGSSTVAGVTVRTVPNDINGKFQLNEVESAIRSRENIHFPPTALLCLENTHNRCGGAVLTPSETDQLVELAHKKDVRVHMDGARIFNAAVYLGIPARTLAENVDSVSFCISKGLGAPVGSLLCGSSAFIDRARKWRKMLGGGMRQVGVVASAGIVALGSMIERLADDHVTAKMLAHGLSLIPGIRFEQIDVQTNIVIFEWLGENTIQFLSSLSRNGVKASFVGGTKIRMVTHAGIEPWHIEEALRIIRKTSDQVLEVKV